MAGACNDSVQSLCRQMYSLPGSWCEYVWLHVGLCLYWDEGKERCKSGRAVGAREEKVGGGFRL